MTHLTNFTLSNIHFEVKPSTTKQQQKNNISTNDLPDSCTCFKCLETINENENNIKCHLCDNQAHPACLNLNKSLADLLKTSDTFPCLCPSCLPKLNKLSTLPDRVESMNQSFTQ
uniref:PHD-type domain-containing protein n=1 Tax=Micrurus paraensis TaxID=1970185 RepID=A0A2D4JXN5_9SAUR